MIARTLYSVAQDAHELITGAHAVQIHDNYLHDIGAGAVTVDRYIGFLSGLAAAGALETVDYYELHEALMALAFQANDGA